MRTSIAELQLRPTDLDRVGRSLARPENVLAFRDGTVFASSNQGYITRIAPDGSQWRIGKTPNGAPTTMALDADDSLIYNDTADGLIYRLHLDGRRELLLGADDGSPLGSANYVFRDSRDRIWIAVATRSSPPHSSLAVRGDGCIAVLEDGVARVVSDDIAWPNEVRLDSSESFAYVSETMGRRILRYRIGSDGTLTDREVFGPDPLGEDLLPDGIAIDADGNLWVAMVTRNGLMVVAADGTTHTVFEDPNEAGLAALRTAYASGFIELPTILACKGESIAALTSIGFGGPDLKTIFMGSLAMPYLLSFRSPVPGLPLRHQDLPKPPPQPETELAHLEDDSDRT